MQEEKIYTKTGDKGTTNLLDDKGVAKDSLRVESYGTIDELNSFLGLSRQFIKNVSSQQQIKKVQRKLFDLGAELATMDVSILRTRIQEEDVAQLEKWIDEILAQIEPPEYFILPGDNVESAYLHVARTVCRRAERHMVTLLREEDISPILLIYINRLSDWLYALSRLEEEHYEKVIF